jgi:glycosyltransferase involved in cell wall biosynthesis
MTKLLILSRYDRQGASSRLRTMQYVPYLQTAGLEVEVSSLFDAAYLADMYAGVRKPARLLNYYTERFRRMRGPRPDIIWVEKEALPWLPWLLERAALPRGVPLVSDYDDAIFHRYDLHRSPSVKRMLGTKIDRVMAHSNLVTAGNAYLAERADQAGAAGIEIVPTVVDMNAYQVRPADTGEKRPRIGWIGTPETWEKFGQPLLEIVRGSGMAHHAVFRAVGAGQPGRASEGLEFFDWSEDSEVSLIQGMDIGIMPLPDTPWARGKCGYKLIQYMACGLPVIASPVGVNSDIVEHGVNGFLADTEVEWKAAVDALLGNPTLRQRMGAAGRQKVEEHYSLQVWGPRVAQMLLDVAKGKQAH